MARKIIIRFGPETVWQPKFHNIFLEFTRTGLLSLIVKLNKLAWVIFLLLAFSAHLFYNIADLGSTIWIYSFILILLGFQIIKKILGKGEYFPIVAYDAQFLLFTTFSAVSLFFTTVSATNKVINIWGGAELRFVSGLSIIAFWFLYYLTVSNFAWKNGFQLIKRLIVGSLFIAVLISGLSGSGVYASLATLYIILFPTWLWLSLSSNKYKWFYLLNMVVSLFFWRQLLSPVNTFIVWITLLLLAFLVVLKNRNGIRSLLRTLDKDINKLISRKIPLNQVVVRNSQVIFLIFALLIGIIGLIWLISISAQGIFTDFVSGFGIVTKDLNLLQALLGRGLVDINGSFITQFVYSYGLLPIILLSAALFFTFKDLIRFLLKKDITNLFLLGFLLPILMLLLLAKITDMIFMAFWMILALIGIHKLLIIDKKEFNLELQTRNASLQLSKNLRITLHSLQIFAVIIITASVIYILSQISKLTSYIDK